MSNGYMEHLEKDYYAKQEFELRAGRTWGGMIDDIRDQLWQAQKQREAMEGRNVAFSPAMPAVGAYTVKVTIVPSTATGGAIRTNELVFYRQEIAEEFLSSLLRRSGTATMGRIAVVVSPAGVEIYEAQFQWERRPSGYRD